MPNRLGNVWDISIFPNRNSAHVVSDWESLGFSSFSRRAQLGFVWGSCTITDLRNTQNCLGLPLFSQPQNWALIGKIAQTRTWEPLGIFSDFPSIRVWIFLGSQYNVRPVPSRPPYQEFSVGHMWLTSQVGKPSPPHGQKQHTSDSRLDKWLPSSPLTPAPV